MNWGKGITIALIAFMSYIIYMAIVLMNQDTELVTPDYYKKEVLFEQEIIAQKNAINNNSKLDLNLSSEGLFIHLNTPDIVNAMHVKLYRPNTKNDDIVVESDGKNIFIDSHELKKGRYLVTAEWASQNKNFQIRDTLWIP